MNECPSCGEQNPASARFCQACGAGLVVGTARETRKLVTVLFADVTGSTALGERLDPESLRHVMARYFEAARAIVERHGGTVEKFIGDAVMAVFGVPAMHEDDALRAVRAAAELRRSIGVLNGDLERQYGVSLELRTGVNTGEVVTGTAERLATGDAVNVAARLEQAAGPGEILIGEQTLRLARAAVRTEPVEALSLKGKADPVPAHRLLHVVEGAPAFDRQLDAPLVGRADELARLRAAFEAAVAERRCRLVTVARAARESASRGSPASSSPTLAGEATVLSGRCLAYGDGITYWPLIEIFRQAGGEDELASSLSADARRGHLLVRTQGLRAPSAGAAAGPGGGRHPLGGAHASRPARARRRVDPGRAGPHHLHGQAGAPRPAPWMGRRADHARAALRGPVRRAHRRAAGRDAARRCEPRADPRGGRRKPALRRAAPGHGD